MHINTKFIAAAAMAAMLVPAIAFAHEDSGKHENENKDTKARVELAAHASSSAATITKGALKIQKIATAMDAFTATIGAQIGSSSQDRFNAYKLALAGAKSQAGLALADAATVTPSTSASTTVTTLAKAKLELKQAQKFLKDARKNLMRILESLWGNDNRND